MRNEKGATLIEIILSVVIIGIIGIIAAQAFLYSTGSVLTGDAVREATQVNRLAMDRMIREMRNVRNNTCVSTATPTTFSFVDAANKMITYSWSGTVGAPLLRTENATTNTIVGSVNSLVFTYYNNADPPVAIPTPTVCTSPNTCSPTLCAVTDIWLIKIDLTTSSGGQTAQFRSQVHPRSL